MCLAPVRRSKPKAQNTVSAPTPLSTRERQDAAPSEALLSFSYESAVRLLASGENENYSPVSLYLALSLAAAGAEGETAAELLNVLGAESRTELADICKMLIQSIYQDETPSKLLLANSLWIGENESFKPDYLNLASSSFFAELYSASFGTASTNKAVSDWIFKNTGETIKPEIALPSDTAALIINTVYFFDEWLRPFKAESTYDNTFYAADGEVTAEFMRQTHFGAFDYHIGENYMRASRDFVGGSTMSFVLPDDGVDIEAFLSSPEALREAFEGGEVHTADEFNWRLPKFEIRSNFALIEPLQRMGCKSAFSPNYADFSYMLDAPVFISDIIQETFIKIDEKGVEAAAYTLIENAASAAPPSELRIVYFTLDRPFFYAIYAPDGAPLFIGICQNPTA